MLFISSKSDFIEYLIKNIDTFKLPPNLFCEYMTNINIIKNNIDIPYSIFKNIYDNKSYYTILNLESSYKINYDLKSDLKNAMNLEYQIFNEYMSNMCNLSDKTTKDLFQFILNSKLMSFNLYNSLYNHMYNRDSEKTTELYYCKEFALQDNTINLIINNIKENQNVLYVDGYIVNLKLVPLSRLFDFYLEIRDSRGIPFASKTFRNIDIAGNLGVFKSKKVLLPFLDKEYNLFDVELSNLTWYYTYDFV